MGSEDEARTRAVYDDVADLYADHFRATEPELPADLAMIDHFAALLPEPRRVLDAGCGAGRMLPYLAARGCHPEGIDLSSEMVRRARQDHPGFTVAVGSLVALPLPDAAFDGVFSWYSTIHNPDADLPVMLGEFSRVLAPGGYVLVGFQTGEGRVEVGQGYRARGHDVELFRFGRSLDAMTSALVASGFEPAARFERTAAAGERQGQGVVIARRP